MNLKPMTDSEIDRTLSKMRTIFRIGLYHGHDALVLGAFGCGAFKNPPSQIAGLFKKVMDSPGSSEQVPQDCLRGIRRP